MKKKRTKIISCIFIILLILFLFFNSYSTHEEKKQVYEWNGGYCIQDGGRLKYINTGSKNHYRCEICNKEYCFDVIMKYDD